MNTSLGENSLEVRWLVLAKRYMMAANTLLQSPDYSRTRALHVPTLHLTGQGIELLLKANLICGGLTTAELKKIGHDLWALWCLDGNQILQDHTFIEGRKVWERAKANPIYEDSFTEDPKELLLQYLKDLSSLHSAESGYALRYVSDLRGHGPRPHLLTETFLEVADLVLKQPTMMHPHTTV